MCGNWVDLLRVMIILHVEAAKSCDWVGIRRECQVCISSSVCTCVLDAIGRCLVV